MAMTHYNEWECMSCTYMNTDTRDKCAMCGTGNPSRGSSSAGGGRPSPDYGWSEWECMSCTYMNTDTRDKCAMCRTRNPSRGSSSARGGRPSPGYGWFGHEVQTDDLSQSSGSFSSSVPGRHGGARRQSSRSHETRIVLIGRTGSGKSATGNTILGREYFHSRAGGCSVTQKCKQTNVERLGRRLQVVDSPGLFDTGMTQGQTTKEIVKCIGMTSPGPHAIILVTRIDRFTQEEQDTVQHFKDVFGEDMTRYLFVLFTRKDDLDAEGTTIKTFVRRVPRMLKDLLQECDMRYIAFNNRLPLEKRDAQVLELLDMIETNIRKNGGSHYTNEMYREAEEVMLRREEALREQLEVKKRREREQIEREFEEKYRYLAQNQQEKVDKLQHRLEHIQIESKTNHRYISEVSELKSKIKDMKEESEKKEREEKRKMEKRLEHLEEENRKAKQEVRDTARKEVEEEDKSALSEIWGGVKNIWGGAKNIGKGVWKGAKNIGKFFGL